ncbi:exonuclease SbcCD subunit D [Candidatus Woesearchaeota archaeon]|nr:exonuclease SbcCD subunit D [Candidatus Woesearchaeota archaeon]
MRFAHLADCHIGSWRDRRLKDISTKAFLKAMDTCLEKSIDFILISGDLFNTSLPAFDNLREVVKKLKQMKDSGVPIYIIPGSHDFSPSGKTILDVLEHAGLLINVVKGQVIDGKLKLNFTVDQKTGTKITGMLGKKGMLEKEFYSNLITEHLESEPGYKIFMFHTALSELKPKELEKMDSMPTSFLPKKFDYYAGGHVHIVENTSLEGYKNVVYPGPIFPNNFSELEKLGNGGFYIIEDDVISYEPILIHNTFNIQIDADHKSPDMIEREILDEIRNQEFFNTIITLRITGSLESGKVSDINFKKIFETIYAKGAYFVMKNTSSLKTKDFEEIKIQTKNLDLAEDEIIKEHLNQIKHNFSDEFKTTKSLMSALASEKLEGERNQDYESRLLKDVKNIINLDLNQSEQP